MKFIREEEDADRTIAKGKCVIRRGANLGAYVNTDKVFSGKVNCSSMLNSTSNRKPDKNKGLRKVYFRNGNHENTILEADREMVSNLWSIYI